LASTGISECTPRRKVAIEVISFNIFYYIWQIEELVFGLFFNL